MKHQHDNTRISWNDVDVISDMPVWSHARACRVGHWLHRWLGLPGAWAQRVCTARAPALACPCGAYRLLWVVEDAPPGRSPGQA